MIPPKVFLRWLDLRAQQRIAGETYREKYPEPWRSAGKDSPEYEAIASAEHELWEFERTRMCGLPLTSQEQREYMQSVEGWR